MTADNRLYLGSDGRYYGDVDIWARFESGTWTPFCWDPETGEEWVDTEDGELLVLHPVPRRVLPDSLSVEHVAAGVCVVPE